MRNHLILCIISLLLISKGANAHPYMDGESDSTRVDKKGQMEETQALRSFPELDKYLQAHGLQEQMLHVSNNAMPEFTSSYIADNFPIADVVADNRSLATETFSEIDRKGRYIDYLSSQDLVELPVGMKKKLGSTNVTIGISKARFMNTYSELTIFCKIDLPQGKSIFLGADKVKLSQTGGIFGDARLVLLGDFQIPINGGNTMIILKGGLDMTTGNVANTGLTGITVTCSGVKDLQVAADVVFPRSLIEPIDANYAVITDAKQQVKGSFSLTVNDWNDIYTTIKLPRFAIHGISQVSFEELQATFDFSDIQSPVELPTNYANLPPSKGLWRGVFIKNVTVILPKEFKKKGSPNSRMSLIGQNILIDNLGFTGLISATNVFQDGTADGWDFSVDKFDVDIQMNTLRWAGFQGAIATPLNQKPDGATSVKQYGLNYAAVFSADNSFLMSVSIKNSMSFDLWKAQATLGTGSSITLTARDGVFRPKANLNGTMNILVTDSGKSTADLNGITFQGLVLQTVTPYVSLGPALPIPSRLARKAVG